MAGLFFCFASAEGAGLLFLPCCNTAPYKRLQRVLCSQCSYTAHATKQRTGLYSGFSCDFTHSTAHDTRPIQTSHCTTCDTPGRCTGKRSRPIIIMYIRWQRCAPVMDPCQTAQHIADHASPAGSAPTVCGRWQVLHPAHLLRGQRLHLYRVSPAPSTRRGSPATGHGGRRGTIGGYRRISFRAFAR